MNFKQSLQIITTAVLIVGSVSVTSAQWNPPSGNAPSGNVDAPIHTGIFGQIKQGALISLEAMGAPVGVFYDFFAGRKNPNNNSQVDKGLLVSNDGTTMMGTLSPGLNPNTGLLKQGLFAASSGTVSIGDFTNALLGGFKGLTILNNGKIQVKTADTAPSGKVLTAIDNSGTVEWMPVSGGNQPPSSGDLFPVGGENDTLRNTGAPGMRTYEASSVLKTTKDAVIIGPKSGNTAPAGLNLVLDSTTGAKGRDALFIRTSTDNIDAVKAVNGQLDFSGAKLKTNAEAFTFFDTTKNKLAQLNASNVLLHDKDASLAISKASGGSYGVPITIDLVHNTGPAGRDAILIKPEFGEPATIITDGGGFQFYDKSINNYAGDRAKIFASQVQLSGGNPGVNKVLASTSAVGDGEWKDVNSLLALNSLKGQIEVVGTVSKVFDGPTSKDHSVSCPSDTVLISGGGACNRAYLQGPINLRPVMESSFGDFTSGTWKVRCSSPAGTGLSISAQAVCLKNNTYVSTSGTPTGNIGGNTTPPVINVCPNLPGGPFAEAPSGYIIVNNQCVQIPTFKNMANSIGNQGESCQDWLKRSNISGWIDDQSWVQYNMFVNTAKIGTVNGKCIYTNASGPTFSTNPLNNDINSCVIGDYAFSPNPLLKPVSSCTTLDTSGTSYARFEFQVRKN